MEKTCNGCVTEKSAMAMVTMSSADWQRNEQRHERREKRHIGIIALLIVLLVGSNAAWLAYESQFETVESITEEDIVVDADGNGTANYIGNDGNIYNGEDNNQEEDDNQNP